MQNKKFKINSQTYEVEILERDKTGDNPYVQFKFQNQEYRIKLRHQNGVQFYFELVTNGQKRNYYLHSLNDNFVFQGNDVTIEDLSRVSTKRSSHHDDSSLKSPMPGKILKVYVSEGSFVDKGQPLLVLEAMKMEHTIKSPEAGVVKKIHVSEGSLIKGGVTLVEVEAN